MSKLTLSFFLVLLLAGCNKSDNPEPDPTDPVNLNCTYAASFTDARDSKVYPVVVIGTQTWMAKNLNYEAAGAGSWCYNCAEYGRLYDWATAKTVAPAGWHLPSAEEWELLVTTLGGLPVAGGKMKSATGWSAPNSGASNSSCFSALPGAYMKNDGNLAGVDQNTAFWTTQEFDGEVANAYVLGHLYGKTQKSGFSKAWGLSVRCIKD
jgi:uncharacterized protein (TIGR02145 family)